MNREPGDGYVSHTAYSHDGLAMLSRVRLLSDFALKYLWQRYMQHITSTVYIGTCLTSVMLTLVLWSFNVCALNMRTSSASTAKWHYVSGYLLRCSFTTLYIIYV